MLHIILKGYETFIHAVDPVCLSAGNIDIAGIPEHVLQRDDRRILVADVAYYIPED